MYRFRAVSNLIGEFQELQKQQIYFAHPEQLNDPMEGMRRYFWQGDEIVWRNLLKHYLLCLEHVVLLARLTEENEQIKKDDIPVYKSVEHLPTEQYKERIQEIYDVFFSNRFVQSYLHFIINNPYKIYSEELYVYLKFLLRYALNAIFEVDARHGLITFSDEINGLKENEQADAFFSNWDKISEFPNSKEMYEQIMKVLYEIMKEMDFQHIIKLEDSVKMQNIYVEFPQMYIEAIKALTYPEAYLACFMDNCTNSSIWGTYGDNHRGVCLKYKIKDEKNPTLNLKTIKGYSSSSGNIYGYVEFPLKKMMYSKEFDELDFFRNIGRLAVNQLNRQWYTNDKGDYSSCSEHFSTNENEEEWRHIHWEYFETAYLKKLPAWSHEREYRIILSSVLDSFNESKNRLLEYNFEELEAIIFGMKTPKEDRKKIIDIVTEKCKIEGIEEFDFYEMAYSNINQEMYTRKIFSIKL